MAVTYPETAARTRSLSALGVTGRMLTTLAALGAGVLFIAYPAIRPFSAETGLEGAQAFASPAWIVAHSLAMAGFILLGLALLGLYEVLRGARVARLSSWGLVLSWIGIGLTLPYYGAEVFGLHAVGQAVVNQNDPALMSIVDDIRWEVGIFWILGGLALLGVGIILMALAIWRSGRLVRWSGVLLALAFALYIPQFVASQPIRVAHGVLILFAAVVLGWAIWPHAGEEARR